jgi:hypothetical protein
MDTLVTERRKVTPEKAIALLKAEGITISPEEAEQLVDFLHFLAEILISDAAAE